MRAVAEAASSGGAARGKSEEIKQRAALQGEVCTLDPQLYACRTIWKRGREYSTMRSAMGRRMPRHLTWLNSIDLETSDNVTGMYRPK